MKGMFGGSSASSATAHPIVELVTAGRTYVLAPARIQMPPPMTTSMAVGPAACGRPLYLFGWPFPVPSLDDMDEDNAETVAQGIQEGRVNSEAFSQWRDVMATAVASEKATRVFPVVVLVDSTAQLPQRVLLRTTPCELAVVSVDDKDLCYTAVPYNDLSRWEVQADTELHVTARTRARLIARADRTGFTSQRPTRPTCHFVFKSAAAKSIVTVIDNHLRALHKQLAGLEGLEGGEADGDYAEQEEVGDLGDAEVTMGSGSGVPGEEDEGGAAAARKKLTGKKSSNNMASAAYEDDPEADAAAARAKPAATYGSGSATGKKKAAAAAAKKRAADSDDSDASDDSAPRKKKSSASKRKVTSDSDSSDSDAKAKKKRGSSRRLADSDDSDSDAKAKKKKSSSSKRKVTSDSDASEDSAPRKSKSKKRVASDSENSDSEDARASKKKSKSKRRLDDSD
jgi:hypothetical protein